jgi:hypothetical protein
MHKFKQAYTNEKGFYRPLNLIDLEQYDHFWPIPYWDCFEYLGFLNCVIESSKGKECGQWTLCNASTLPSLLSVSVSLSISWCGEALEIVLHMHLRQRKEGRVHLVIGWPSLPYFIQIQCQCSPKIDYLGVAFTAKQIFVISLCFRQF